MYEGALRSIERRVDMETFSEDLEDDYHNEGHQEIAKDCSEGGFGPMRYSEVSARDPIFWVWHKHLDSIFQQYKEATQKR